MMSVELLQMLSLVSYILAGVLFVVAIILFLILDIKKVIGDISGITARKAIEDIRQQNETTGEKTYQSSMLNVKRGKRSNKILSFGRLEQYIDRISSSMRVKKVDTNTDKPNPQARETMVLTPDIQPISETTVLSPDGQFICETTTLQMTDPSSALASVSISENFVVDIEMGFTGSSELIE